MYVFSFEKALTLTVNDLKEITEPYQKVYIDKDTISFVPDQKISVPLMYTASNQDQSLTGVNINIHFDSSVLYPTGDNNGIDYQFETDIQGTSIVNDTKDLDNDAQTDKYLQLVYSKLNSSFLGKDLPVEIATVHFQTQEPGIDPVTGQYIPTTLKIYLQ